MIAKAVGFLAYYLARLIVWLLAKLYWRIDLSGLENVPKSGAFIFAPVHRSNIDGPLTVIFTWRRMAYLAKDGMFKYRPLGWLFTSMGAIPVERGTPDRQSLALCMKVLEAGSPLVLFPEGGRRAGQQVVELMEGAVYLASKVNVPIVPVGIGGSEEANPKGSAVLRPAKVAVVIGEPMTFTPPEGASRYPRAAIRSSTEELHVRLQGLFDEALVRAGRKAK